jgi:hypothetical protein
LYENGIVIDKACVPKRAIVISFEVSAPGMTLGKHKLEAQEDDPPQLGTKSERDRLLVPRGMTRNIAHAAQKN